MEDRLQLLLADLSEIEQEIDSMVHVLEIWELGYDMESLKEAQYCVQVFSGWVKNLKGEVAAVCDGMDFVAIRHKN